ncbi:MAG: type IV pilin [Haloarculaceae archaeon]
MQLKALFNDDDAVSPVIGVILMVAITVILAAVIASFVLGLGDQATQGQPTASFDFNYQESSGSNAGVLTISHSGGDTIEAQALYVRGDSITSAPSGMSADLSSAGSWSSTSQYGDTSEITSGKSIDVGVNSDYQIDVVWEPPEHDTSATLAEDSGPDA